jgi:hypothetical protein
MLDVLIIGLVLLFFLLADLLVRGCRRIVDRRPEGGPEEDRQ